MILPSSGPPTEDKKKAPFRPSLMGQAQRSGLGAHGSFSDSVD